MSDNVGVIFIKDTQNVHTGNEFYPAGTAAHFPKRNADALMNQGAVKSMNASIETGPEPVVITIDYESMTLKELRAMAKAGGVDGYSRMKKAQLIERLENKHDD